MSGLCAICSKGSAPFGLFDPLKPIGARSYTWFCRPEHQMLWLFLEEEGIDRVSKLTAIECKAIEAILPAVGQYVVDKSIGKKPINDLGRDDVLGLIASCVRSFQDKMEEITSEDGPPF